MELKIIKVEPDSPLNEKVDRLLNKVFPKTERYSMDELKFWSTFDTVEYKAFLDGNTFVGFYYIFQTEKMIWGLYLAVEPSLQSKGYGSAVIKQYMQLFADKEIVFGIEVPDENADNAEQRIRRLKLYERHGLNHTGYSYFIDSDKYWLMSSKGKDFDKEEFLKLYGFLTGGKDSIELIKE